jgi:hypothetical protein
VKHNSYYPIIASDLERILKRIHQKEVVMAIHLWQHTLKRFSIHYVSKWFELVKMGEKYTSWQLTRILDYPFFDAQESKSKNKRLSITSE